MVRDVIDNKPGEIKLFTNLSCKKKRNCRTASERKPSTEAKQRTVLFLDSPAVLGHGDGKEVRSGCKVARDILPSPPCRWPRPGLVGPGLRFVRMQLRGCRRSGGTYPTGRATNFPGPSVQGNPCPTPDTHEEKRLTASASREDRQGQSEKRCSGRRDGLYTHSGVSTPRSTQPADSALFRTCLLLWDTPGASSWRIFQRPIDLTQGQRPLAVVQHHGSHSGGRPHTGVGYSYSTASCRQVRSTRRCHQVQDLSRQMDQVRRNDEEITGDQDVLLTHRVTARSRHRTQQPCPDDRGRENYRLIGAVPNRPAGCVERSAYRARPTNTAPGRLTCYSVHNNSRTTFICLNSRHVTPAWRLSNSRKLDQPVPTAKVCQSQRKRTGRQTPPSQGRHGMLRRTPRIRAERPAHQSQLAGRPEQETCSHLVTVLGEQIQTSVQQQTWNLVWAHTGGHGETEIAGVSRETTAPYSVQAEALLYRLLNAVEWISALLSCADITLACDDWGVVPDSQSLHPFPVIPDTNLTTTSHSPAGVLPGAAADTPVPDRRRVKGRPSLDGYMVLGLGGNDKAKHKATTNTQTTAAHKNYTTNIADVHCRGGGVHLKQHGDMAEPIVRQGPSLFCSLHGPADGLWSFWTLLTASSSGAEDGAL
ncbi:hypothetical protein Bbelb_442580 [Branchiostoma belcheri]|nr:hypothetical protein Bbelb_442580 [Branchiostoma belcheri]